MNYSIPSLSFNLPFFTNLSIESVAGIVFFLVLIFVAAISVIMFYHWKKYSFSGKTFAVTELIYLVVVVVLVSTAFLGLK